MNRDRRNGLFLLVCAIAGAAALHLTGRGILVPPSTWSSDAWRAALEDRGALTVALSAVRVLALAACVYLAMLGALTALLARTRHRALRRLRLALTPRVLRPVLGLLTVATLAGPAHAADTASDPPVMVLVTTTSAPAPPGAPPTMRRLPSDDPGAPVAVPAVRTPPAIALPTVPSLVTPVRNSTTAQPSPPQPAPVTRMAAPATWTVERGDHFWHIAERTRGAQLGRPPTERETTAYWRALVAANRDRLVDPANPDLLFAGQELTLPPGG